MQARDTKSLYLLVNLVVRYVTTGKESNRGPYFFHKYREDLMCKLQSIIFSRTQNLLLFLESKRLSLESIAKIFEPTVPFSRNSWRTQAHDSLFDNYTDILTDFSTNMRKKFVLDQEADVSTFDYALYGLDPSSPLLAPKWVVPWISLIQSEGLEDNHADPLKLKVWKDYGTGFDTMKLYDSGRVNLQKLLNRKF